MTESPKIELDGVATHNLKDIAAQFPLGRLSVVTGVSGSGKTSLVFDSLYGESYRRYVESLSSFARQYLKSLPKPEIKSVRNLPPAIAVRQSRSGATNRSTVGTMTELNDILRILFRHLSEIHCQKCSKIVRRDTPQDVYRAALQTLDGQKILVCAPLSGWDNLKPVELRDYLEAQGFSRCLDPKGETVRLEDAKLSQLKKSFVILDRLTIAATEKARLFEATTLAFKLGRGRMTLVGKEHHDFDSNLECCGITYVDPSESLFSYNHPLGACQSCQGFGYTSELNWDKIIPDGEKSLSDEGVAAWNFGQFREFYQWAITSGKDHGVTPKKPFAKYTKAQMAWLMDGDDENYYPGILGFFAYMHSKRYKTHYRIHAARFHHYVLCQTCSGSRLNEIALACLVDGKNFAEVCQLNVAALSAWSKTLEQLPTDPGRLAANPNAADQVGAVREAFAELSARLRYLGQIGLGYLTLQRSSRSLSGGELQRIHMARCLGSALTDTLYCLDEPTAGLHARDSENLLGVVKELCDQGNTVVVVEHERTLIDGADHLVEIGPAAGHLGGEVVFAGSPRNAKEQPSRQRTVQTCSNDPNPGPMLKLKGVKTNNLKNVTAQFPIGCLTVVCGVSGSGKTSLVQHTLYPMMAKALGKNIAQTSDTRYEASSITPKKLVDGIHDIELVSQSPLGRSTRSNIATFLGVMDHIRKLMAEQPQARHLGLKPGAFSFNTSGGRCETCRGLGTVVEDLSFLGEMEVVCHDCGGRRFSDPVLSVEYRGANLIDILGKTVAQAREHFHDLPQIANPLDIVVNMGLGYLTLGQHTSSFSGGEAQRLKLANILLTGSNDCHSMLIFDEPSTGLSDRDVDNLIRQLKLLRDRGHTVVVVEHHLDLIAAADWLIEIGPEAAEAGGDLVYEGPVRGLKRVKSSQTAPYLF